MKTYSFAKIVVRGFPTMAELNNPYIYTPDVKVVLNVSEHEYPKEIEEEFNRRGVRMEHLPLVEEGPDMGFMNIIWATTVLEEADEAGEKIVVHCGCGNNRSRTVVEAYYFEKYQKHFEDEYKGYPNHLLYNIGEGHLPSRKTVEDMLNPMGEIREIK